MAKKKVINLPRGYLSFSQMSLWMSDKERYKEIYFNERDYLKMSSRAMDYGKMVATSLETERETGDLLTDTAISLLPKYDIADKEIRASLKTKDGEIILVGRPDTMDSKTFAFREYKTGRIPWTQKKAQDHLQMKFYMLLIHLKHSVILKEAYLDWIETEYTPEGTVKPTGHIESFKVTLTLRDLIHTMALVSSVAKEIEVEWAMYVPTPEIPF